MIWRKVQKGAAPSITATATIAVKVAGHDFERGKLRLMAALHTLGVEE